MQSFRRGMVMAVSNLGAAAWITIIWFVIAIIGGLYTALMDRISRLNQRD